MSPNTYTLIVVAVDELEAIDKARREAWDDGYRMTGLARQPHRVGPPELSRWSVTVYVEKRA